MSEAEFKKSLTLHIKEGNVKMIKSICHNLSFSTIMHYLSENEKVKLISHQKSSNFTKDLFSWLHQVNEVENHRYPGLVDEKILMHIPHPYDIPTKFTKSTPSIYKLFEKNKIGKIEEFKFKLFIYTVETIKKDDKEVFNILKQLNPNSKCMNSLGARCATWGLETLINEVMKDFKSNKKEFPQTNKRQFIKTIVKHCNADFLDSFYHKHTSEVKEIYNYLCSKEQFWLYYIPQAKKMEKLQYASDTEIFNISFSFEKLMWLEKANLGLKKTNYKNLDLFLPMMTGAQINEYINLDKEKITDKIRECLKERQSDIKWTTLSYALECDGKISQYDRISKMLLHTSLSNTLPEKQSIKTRKL